MEHRQIHTAATAAATPPRAAARTPTRDQPAAFYQVSTIDTPQALTGIRADWDNLHRRDPQSGFYLSYPWLARVLNANPGRWRVYVVRSAGPQGRIVCLFPAAVERTTDRSDGTRKTRLSPAGRLTLSDQTGFLCHPDHVEAGLAALAQHLAREEWSRFSMRYEPTQTRARQFAAGFAPDRFRVSWKDCFINDGRTNYLLCPQISLPADFDTYLMARLGGQTRRSMRRAMRTHIDSGDTHITTATEQTLERDLAILFDLWARQWAAEYDDRALARAIRRHRRFFDLAQSASAFRLTVLWQGPRAIGAQACIVDRTRGHLIAKMGTRSLTAKVPVGNLLFLHEIQWAIAQGFKAFNLGHGDAPYKYSFGAVDQQICYFTIRRRTQGQS